MAWEYAAVHMPQKPALIRKLAHTSDKQSKEAVV